MIHYFKFKKDFKDVNFYSSKNDTCSCKINLTEDEKHDLKFIIGECNLIEDIDKNFIKDEYLSPECLLNGIKDKVLISAKIENDHSLLFREVFQEFTITDIKIDKFDYEEEIKELEEENKKLKEENKKLKEENRFLKEQIDYAPGGQGYLETKAHFEKIRFS